MAERPGSRRSILGIFDCWSAGLYRLVSRSWLGRCLTGYRREPTALLSGETRARGMHAMSDRRCRVVRAAEGSRVLAVARRLVHLLADCPARLYGLFFLLYGIVCCPDPPAAAVPDSRTVAGFARHCFQRHSGTGSSAVCHDAALSRGRCRKRQGRVCADLPAARYAGGSGRRSVYRNANRAVLRCRRIGRRCRRRDGLDTSDDHPGRIPDARTSLHGAVPPGDGGRAVGAHVACRLDMGARPARAGSTDSFDVGGLRLQIASDAPLLPAGQAGCRHASVRNPAGRRRTVRRAFSGAGLRQGLLMAALLSEYFPDSQSHEFPCRVAAVHGRRRRDTGADSATVLRPTAPGGILRLAG